MSLPLAFALALLPAAAPPAAAPATVDPALPRVLLIGDSISMGYTDPVRTELAGEANVFRIPVNGGDTERGLQNLDAWLGDEPWDAIHANWGLHDVAHVDAAGARVAPPAGAPQVSPQRYAAHLAALLDRLEATGAKIIWASTTPIPPGSGWRITGSELTYNALAADVLKDRDVRVNDLHAVAAAAPAGSQRPKDVHFTPAGSRVLAKAVAGAVRQALAASGDRAE